jgi:hypothetical protein
MNWDEWHAKYLAIPMLWLCETYLFTNELLNDISSYAHCLGNV